MGLFRRSAPPATVDLEALADVVADRVKAALPVPVAAQPGYDQFYAPMFAPGMPLTPYPIDPREPSGTVSPRRSEFATSVNLNLQRGWNLVPFSVLRDVADQVEVIRSCIRVRKAQMHALDFDITLTRQATRRVMHDDKIDNPGEAAQVAREKFEPEMIRLREWWETPDRFNSMDYATWLGALLEDQLVLDAATVWPRRQLNGDVVALEVIDGSTVKPLLDHRGAAPMPPAPAYQQVLHGFPRGDFTASNDGDSYGVDQIVYRPRFRRTFTPYGYPEVEQALSQADLYLKRMAWIRGEFTDGRVPDSWVETPESSKMNPTQMREWEVAINAEQADPAARRELRMLPPGAKAIQMAQFADLYKPELDEALIKLMCMSFGVMPTEIGFPPSSGIGGKGHQEGEANSAWRKTTRPYAQWIEGLLTELSRRFLKMPPELQFKLVGYEVEDQSEAETVANSLTRRGAITLNDDRAARGMPLYNFKEADTPFIVTGSGLVFLEGAIDAQSAGVELKAPAPIAEAAPTEPTPPASATDPRPPDGTPEDGDPIADDAPVPDGFIRISGHLRSKPTRAAVADEVTKFVRFAAKRAGRPWRPFAFELVDPWTAVVLNKAAELGDDDLLRRLVADVGKARARRVSRADKTAIVKRHTDPVTTALQALFPSGLIDAWTHHLSLTKTSADEHHEAAMFVRQHMGIDPDFDDLDDELASFVTTGHGAAFDAAVIDDLEDDTDDEEADDLDPAHGSRLAQLLGGVPDLRDALVGLAIGYAVDTLFSNDPPAELVLDDTVAEPFLTTELTATLTAGSLDAAQAQAVAYVQIVATPECDFCQGYEGRILSIDDDAGMPPLHRGCQCDIEPLA